MTWAESLRAADYSEEAVCFGPQSTLCGVATRAAGETCGPAVLLLNSGRIPRGGPARLYVRLARCYAARGYNSLRFDFSRIGDDRRGVQTEDAEKRRLEEAHHALLEIQRLGLGEGIVALGICLGGDVGFDLACFSEAVVGAILINARLLPADAYFDGFHEKQAELRARSYRRKALSVDRWRRLLSGRSRMAEIASALRTPRRHSIRLSDEDWKPLCELLQRPTPLLTLYSDGCVMRDHLETRFRESPHEPAWKELEFQPIDHCDQVLTPVWAQHHLLRESCRWLAQNAATWRRRLDRPTTTSTDSVGPASS